MKTSEGNLGGDPGGKPDGIPEGGMPNKISVNGETEGYIMGGGNRPRIGSQLSQASAFVSIQSLVGVQLNTVLAV